MLYNYKFNIDENEEKLKAVMIPPYKKMHVSKIINPLNPFVKANQQTVKFNRDNICNN